MPQGLPVTGHCVPSVEQLRVQPFVPRHFPQTARAGNRRFRLLSALRAHTKTPYRTHLYRKTLRVLKRPGRPGPPLPQPEVVCATVTVGLNLSHASWNDAGFFLSIVKEE